MGQGESIKPVKFIDMTTYEIKIEGGIPLPQRNRFQHREGALLPFTTIIVGESFFRSLEQLTDLYNKGRRRPLTKKRVLQYVTALFNDRKQSLLTRHARVVDYKFEIMAINGVDGILATRLK